MISPIESVPRPENSRRFDRLLSVIGREIKRLHQAQTTVR